MRIFEIKNFDKGLRTQIEDYSIPEEAASKSLNWFTAGDKIEFAGGYTILGEENETVGGKITGLIVANDVSGNDLVLRSRDSKIEYLKSDNTWGESGSDILGAAANGEDIAFEQYVSLAGYAIFVSSPNSGLYKIMMANPANVVTLTDSAGTFRGYIKIANSRLHLWHRKNNKNYLYGSFQDFQNSTVYTAVSGEAIGGSGSKTYTGTLAFKAGGAKRTCFGIVITEAGGEKFTDNKDGTLTGSAGGTGTINYATGAYSVTFNATTTGAVTVAYSWVDSSSKELADFTYSATRVAGEGFFLPQPTGGDLLNVLPYKTGSTTEYYCIHEKNCYLYSMPIDDLSPTNNIFREKVGMDNWRSAIATGDGIYYIDTSAPSEPRLKLLSLSESNDLVIPMVRSYALSLVDYDFSDCAVGEFGDFILWSCKTKGAIANNRVFLFNRLWNTFDVFNYGVTSFSDKSGVLIAGDSQSYNVLNLFTGYTQNGNLIENYWEGKLSKLEIDEIKKFKRLTVQGEIGKSQVIKVSLSFDRGSFVEAGEIRGDYVDKSQAITVGSPVVGSKEVGGGGADEAFNYIREFRVRTKRFSEVKVRFETLATGYASISNIKYYDLQLFGKKNIQRYRTKLTT